jgi:SH3-like domain-containing protein
MRRGILAALVVATALSSLNAAAAPAPDANLPVPRYVSLKAEANGRHGPGVQHRVDWVYERAGLPLQVIGISGPWRRVRDPDGVETWIYAQSLEERRTAYFKRDAQLLHAPHQSSSVAVHVAAGVVGGLTGCEGDWRRISVGSHVGWVDKSALWGADNCAGV